jgi:hypothetical protein
VPVVIAPPSGEPALLPGNDVFIVGAGFSRAICPDAMPTLDELGRRVAGQYRERSSFALLPPSAAAALNAGRMPTGTLEGWLSHLATPAPFLDEAERHFNRGIGEELTGLIVEEIVQSEATARTKPMPQWLARLIRLWDRTAATIITFNYDTLIERAVPAAQMPWVSYPSTSAPIDMISPLQLLKLHGSINWWRLPSDHLGNSVDVEPLDGGWGGPPQPRLAGMVPLVVPPLAVKSEYYDLSIVRDAWQRARRALSQATRLVVIGYSAPTTDLTVGALLSQHLRDGAPAAVIDITAERVAQRLQAVGLAAAVAHTGDKAISAFVDDYERDLSHKAPAALLRLFDGFDAYPDAHVVGWQADRPRPLPITGIIREGNKSVLLASDTAELHVKRNDLRQAVSEAASLGNSLVLRVDGEPERPVWHIDYRHLYTNFYTVEA